MPLKGLGRYSPSLSFISCFACRLTLRYVRSPESPEARFGVFAKDVVDYNLTYTVVGTKHLIGRKIEEPCEEPELQRDIQHEWVRFCLGISGRNSCIIKVLRLLNFTPLPLAFLPRMPSLLSALHVAFPSTSILLYVSCIDSPSGTL